MLKKLLILVFISLFFSSCSRNSVEEITFSSWGSVTEVQIIKKLISDFEKENPDIKINFMHIPQNYYQKIHLLFASSQAPDVVFINNLYLPVYCNNLEDLSEIIEKKDFFPQSIEAMSINGKLYAVPRDVSNYVFYYNKNIVGRINSSWSFAEFENIINKTNTKGKWGVSFEPNILLAEPYILTLGMDKGINYYKNLQGKYAPTPSQIGSSTGAQMFLEGKIGLYLSGRWMYPKISQTANFPFGIVPFPGETYSDASGWAISKTSKHKQSAKKFIRYMSSDKSTDFFTESGLIVPARQNSAEKIKEKAFLYAISKSIARKPDKNFNRNRDKLNKQYFGL